MTCCVHNTTIVSTRRYSTLDSAHGSIPFSLISFIRNQNSYAWLTTSIGLKEYAGASFNFYINSSNPAMHVRLLISGLNGKNTCSIQYKAHLDDTYTTLKIIREDGILEVDVPESAITVLYFYIYDKENTDAITIEQLPLYPGALVSDGIDDYGETAEAISEEIGTVIVHGHFIDNNPKPTYYLYSLGKTTDLNRLTFSSTDIFLMQMPPKSVNFNDKVNFLSRIPARVEDSDKLTIFNYSATSLNYSKCFLSRLILIKEQLDDAQLETLTWKVSKEYRDWCKENGYEYAITEMLNN